MGEPMTKQRLSQYIYLKMEVEHQEERIARMKREETIPGPADRRRLQAQSRHRRPHGAGHSPSDGV